jgi:hypothetical protein
MNKSKIDQLKDALTTDFIEADAVSVYTPDGQPEGIVTIEFKKWEGHAEVNYFQVSIKFTQARALAVQLEAALSHLDSQLYAMKENRRG